MSNQFNVQTVGDEAIYVKFPGETTSPIPKSKHSLSIPSGYREIRRITDKNNKVIWAHKWRLTLNGDNCTFTMSSTTDPTFTRSGNVGRCKDGKNISVAVKANDGYRFRYWSDNNTNPSRTFTMTDHKSLSANIIQTFVVRFVDYNGTVLKTQTVDYGSDATAPNDPTRTGYRFTGWDIAFTNVKSNLTVTAQYIQQFSVKFYAFKSATTHVKEIKVDINKTINEMTGQSVPTESITGISGWSFDGWHDKSGGGATPKDRITKDVNFYAYWYKTIYNSTFGTDMKHPDTDQGIKEITSESYIFIYTPFGTNLSLPVGARTNILHISGLLQHDGEATNHYLIITLAYASKKLNLNCNTFFINTKHSYDTVKWGTKNNEKNMKINAGNFKPSIDFRENNPEIAPITETDVKISGLTKTYGWKYWAFLKDYNNEREYSFEHSGSYPDVNNRAETLTRYGYDDTYHKYTTYIQNSTQIVKQISENKSSQSGTLWEYIYDDTSDSGTTIPAELNGGIPDKLCLILSKQHADCNVDWNFMCHVITIDLT